MEFKLVETRWYGNILLVLYDWEKFPDHQRIRNVYAYDKDGERLWIAEQRRLGDSFVGFVGSGSKLQVTTWDCFCCTLDHETGKIIDSKFTK